MTTFFYRRIGALLFILTTSMPVFAAPPATCTTAGEPWLTLNIIAGAMSPDADRTTAVRVYQNGCSRIHRPAFLRAAGDYRLPLRKDETTALRAQLASDDLRGFDEPALHAAIAARQRRQAATAPRQEVVAVMDGDRYELSWNDNGTPRHAAWVGPGDYAQAFSEIAALQAFDRITTTLRTLAARSDATRVTEGAP